MIMSKAEAVGSELNVSDHKCLCSFLSPKTVPIIVVTKQKQRQSGSYTSLKKSYVEINNLRLLTLKDTIPFTVSPCLRTEKERHFEDWVSMATKAFQGFYLKISSQW